MRSAMVAFLGVFIFVSFVPLELEAGWGGGGGGGGGPVGRGGVGGKPISFPCEWVKGVSEGQAKVGSERELLYLYFHFPRKVLQGNFHVDKLMQKLSKEKIIFVDVAISKPFTQEDRELIKQYNIKRLPHAVITDRYTNCLVGAASSKHSTRLEKQILLAEKALDKLLKTLNSTFENAREKCESRDYKSAVSILNPAKKRNVKGYRIVKKINWLFSEINDYMQRQLNRVLLADITTEQKTKLLSTLQSKVDRELPVYEEIKTAFGNVRKASQELERTFKKACLYCEKREYKKALELLSNAKISRSVALPVNKKIDWLFSEIKRYMAENKDLSFAD